MPRRMATSLSAPFITWTIPARRAIVRVSPSANVPGSFDPLDVGVRPVETDLSQETTTPTCKLVKNWIQYQRNQLGLSDWQIAYGYGPGPTTQIRTDYANDASMLRNMYAPFLNCLKTGQ
jgi:hypothetical protein